MMNLPVQGGLLATKRGLIPLETRCRQKKGLVSLTGLTLFEIMVATILLAIIMTGLVSVVVAGKRYILHSRSRMACAELGKLFLGPFQINVRQGESSPGSLDGWDESNNLLRVPAGTDSRSWTGSPEVLDGITFTPYYTVSKVRDALGNDTGLRRVKAVISWEELSS